MHSLQPLETCCAKPMENKNTDAAEWSDDKIIGYVVKRHRWICDSGGWDIEDLWQFGRMGMMRARATYSPDRGRPFRNWAITVVRQYIRRYAIPHRHAITVDERVVNKSWAEGKPAVLRLEPRGDLSGESFLEFLLEPEVPVDPVLGADRILAVIETLKPRDQRIVELIYSDGLSHKAAGKEIGLTRQRVAQLLEQILVTIRKRLNIK